MKLQTNKRPYNTIGAVHHITMDKQEFDYLTLSVKSTTALHNFMKEYDEYKSDAFYEEKFVVILTPDDCDKPDHKMSFAFFGKVNPKYIDEYNKKLANQRWYNGRDIPKDPVLCLYRGNTDRWRKLECDCVVSEKDFEKFLVEGPANIVRSGYRGMFGEYDRYGSTYFDNLLLGCLKKKGE